MVALGATMLPAPLAHVDAWIFDLDNSLYPASTNLFALIDVRMGEFIQQLLGCDAVEARRGQKAYFFDHGTTFGGVVKTHGAPPRGVFDLLRSGERRVGEEGRGCG